MAVRRVGEFHKLFCRVHGPDSGVILRLKVLLAAALVLPFASVCHASPVTYTITDTASGSLNGTTFSNAGISVTFTGDTSGVFYDAYYTEQANTDIQSATITIDGLGTYAFTGAAEILSGYSTVTFKIGTDPWFMQGFIGTNYDLLSSFATVTSYNGWNSDPFATSGGTLQFTGISGEGTFGAAVDSGLAPTPEPSSLMLMATGAMGVVGAARRKFLQRA